MRLQRLIVQGFKSFKDRTTIEFDDGITGIVGPNGCGKSNIVDALFWVMGEQSAKHLRGTSMKDLIFSGSSKYSPAAFAEVTLVLENDTGKHIHISGAVVKPQEIQLTRKLYRNGETEYRINNEPARLKDIQEVFMDTGAGAKSYSIIAQGEINKLVQAKPEERRVMIEEVAGITKFKLRKRESLKKIEATQLNLARLDDLQNEIYKNLKSLEKQAEKAEKAKTLRERIQKYELIVEAHRELELLQDFVEAQDSFQVRAEEKEKILLEKNQLEIELEEEKIKKEELMELVDIDQAEFNQESKSLAASEEKIKHLKKSLKDKLAMVEQKIKENKELEVEKEERVFRLRKLEDELKEMQNLDHESIDLGSLEEKVELLKIQLMDLEEEFQQEEQRFQKNKNELLHLDHELLRNQSKLEDCARLLQDLTLEIEGIEKSTFQWSDDLHKEKDRVAKLLTDKQYKADELSVVKQANIHHQEILKSLSQKYQSLQKELMKTEAQYESLVAIKKEEEAQVAGAKEILEKTDRNSVILLGSELKIQPEYAVASEKLLSHLMSQLVTKGKDQFLPSLEIEGSFEMIVPLDYHQSVESIERLKLQGLKNLVPLQSVATIDAQTEMSAQIGKLLEGYFIADEIDKTILSSINFDISFRGIVSKDGKIFIRKTADGVQLVQSTHQSQMGQIERNNLIDEIGLKLEQLRAEYSSLSQELEQRSMEVSRDQEKEQQLAHLFQQSSVDWAQAHAALESKEKLYVSSHDKLSLLLKRRQETSQLRLELIEKEEKIKLQLDSEKNKTKRFEDIKDDYLNKISDARINYENEKDSYRELKIKVETYTSQLTSLQSQVEDVGHQIDKITAKLATNLELIQTAESQLSAMEHEIVEVESFNREQAEILSQKEDKISLLKDELTSLLLFMQEKDSKLKTLQNRLIKLDKENVETEYKMAKASEEEEVLARNIFEKYRVDLRTTIRNYLGFTEERVLQLKDISSMFRMMTEEGETVIESLPYEFQKMFPGEIKERREKLKEYRAEFNRLGEINWQAIEDYDRQKLRYDFLKSQQDELQKSLADLQTAIQHIDEKSKIRFKEAFVEVNERFSKVFPIIFGGGSAKLELVGSLDDPECGVDIIAQPPGKKMQSIQLMSGGEKAMTAVSLIFSIFLVKPSPFCLLDEVDAPLDDANVGRFNELLREMSTETQFILITHNKKTMELNDTLYGVTMQEPGVSKAVSVQLH